METQQYLDQLAQNSERLADAAAAAGTDAPVPSCPGWTVTDLLAHCAAGDSWARTIVEQGRAGSTDRVDRGAADPALQGDALVQAFRDAARALVAALSSVTPDTPVWTFSSTSRTASFWQRRRAQETAVHRYDAELAAGAPTPVDAELAVDGIDEILTVFLPRLADNFGPIGDGTVHLHCTDVDGEWLFARRDGEIAVTAEHAKGDVAARGTASDLLLFVWGRVPSSQLEVFGDVALLERFGEGMRV
ncbi:MAG TPA: maleylpyruvate isomerase family mycothiol-dependent enzyme [Acidimicrobiia bacterium]